MKAVLFAIALTISFNAHAAKWVFVNGKLTKPGPAKIALMKDPKADVIEVTSRRVEISETSGNFKKNKDLSPAETIKALGNAKE